MKEDESRIRIYRSNYDLREYDKDSNLDFFDGYDNEEILHQAIDRLSTTDWEEPIKKSKLTKK